MTMNLEALMLTVEDITLLMEKYEYLGTDELSAKDILMLTQAAVAKALWGLSDWLNTRGDFMKAEVEPDRAAELWWASGTIVEALQAAGLQRPEVNHDR